MYKHDNVGGAGAAMPKTGKNREALSRPAGMSATLGAVHSKTCSRYKGSSKHNHWEGTSGYGGNENIVGY